MPNAVLARVEELAQEIAATADANESLGRLDDAAVKVLRDCGVMRMFQPARYGGAESHPAEFAEAVMRISSLDGSTGWVSGIVGVHPWEMAMADPRVQEEVWGADQETWIASPYAPMGVLRPVEGGYVFNGRWQYSSGTDHCTWIFLGALMGDADGNPDFKLGGRHVILPRSDYEIIDGTWDVVGLRGTGSKDVVVKDAFVPDYRVIEFDRMLDGSAAEASGLDNPTFKVPFTTIFPLGITSAVIGICEGALAHALAYQSTRVQVTGTKVKDDPYVLSAIGEASAEIHASRVVMLDNVNRTYDRVAAGEILSFAERSLSRRTQVAAAWRAVRAMDEIMARSGGNAMRMDNPLQRFWRDGHMGLGHAIHVPGSVFHASTLGQLDMEPPPGPMRAMI